MKRSETPNETHRDHRMEPFAVERKECGVPEGPATLSRGENGPWRLETCFQSRGCPNGVLPVQAMADQVGEFLSREGVGSGLAEKAGGSPMMHHLLRISVSGCPNACSRPQIADIGIIGALVPAVSGEECSLCGACVDRCRERAIELRTGASAPTLIPERCLLCGECVRACPSGAIEEGTRGCRILVGGKLGRHPQLAKELEGLKSPGEVLGIIRAAFNHYIEEARKGQRFGTLLNRTGIPFG